MAPGNKALGGSMPNAVANLATNIDEKFVQRAGFLAVVLGPAMLPEQATDPLLELSHPSFG
jgi:hypothetical protein